MKKRLLLGDEGMLGDDGGIRQCWGTPSSVREMLGEC
jgi:hypothetical protein